MLLGQGGGGSPRPQHSFSIPPLSLIGCSHPGVSGTSPRPTLWGPACATPPQLPSCSAPRRPGQGAERVYAAQRGQSWEGPGQRPLP